MKITMYELLGLVKDGKAPKKIKFRNEIYEYKNNAEGNFIDYVGIEKETNERFYLSSYIGNNYISDIFTDEVEIIEEPKKIEKIDFGTLNTQKEKNRAMKDAINKLIDAVNELKRDK